MARKYPLALGFLLGLLTLLAGLQFGGTIAEGWQLAARWTGRAGFPLLIAAYSASSLARLWPAPWSRSLLRDRRWWGLGFAISHTIHLYALIIHFQVSDAPPLAISIYGGGFGYLLLYAMVLTSTPAAQRAMGRSWKQLHSLGVHFLWFIFAFDFTSLSFSKPDEQAFTIPAAIVVWAALALRLAARRKARAG